jgi:phage terminase large subunit-like protein
VGRSPKTELALLPPERQAQWLAQQPDWVIQEILKGEWWWTGRPEQQPPPGDWFIWLLLSGRGFGKTRTAAEWLADRVLRFPIDTAGFRTEWLIIGETLTDGLRFCVTGPAGIGRVFSRRIGDERRSVHDRSGRWKLYRGQKPFIQLYDKKGSEAQIIYVEGADDEDVARGYNASGAWLDEFAKWKKPDGSWAEGIMPSLRADIAEEMADGTLRADFPRVIVATTPKLVAQLIEWVDRTDGTVRLTTGSTYENASNLAGHTLAELHRRYAGTRLGQQELEGRLIREIQGALWKLDWINRWRVEPNRLPALNLKVIGMDPAGSGERDETGLICAAKGSDTHDYILGDWSKQVAGAAAARRAWEMYLEYGADWIVIETNIAKKWLMDVMVQEYKIMQNAGHFPPGGNPPIKTVNAKVGKKIRAEPVAARYEQGNRVHHVREAANPNRLGDLETQMISWVPDETPDSPDRVDALVYAELALYETEARHVQAASAVDRVLPNMGSMGPLAGGRTPVEV